MFYDITTSYCLNRIMHKSRHIAIHQHFSHNLLQNCVVSITFSHLNMFRTARSTLTKRQIFALRLQHNKMPISSTTPTPASMTGGHAQYVKGYVNEMVGNVTGSENWKESGKMDQNNGIREMRVCNSNRRALGQRLNHVPRPPMLHAPSQPLPVWAARWRSLQAKQSVAKE
jgi:uncharacterized protein YjbJ (UPF0337 family)